MYLLSITALVFRMEMIEKKFKGMRNIFV